MKAFTALVYSAALTSAAPAAAAAETDANSMSFAAFKTRFGKSYATAKEEAHREEVFRGNLKTISEHNAKSGRSYTLGVTQFADLETDEWRARVLLPSGRKLKAAPPGSSGAHAGEKSKSTKTKGDDPSSLDWAALGMVSKVKDQGYCGSCWSFSATGAVESAWAILQNVSDPTPSLSEQQILDCARESWGNNGCGGGDMRTAFDYMRQAQLSSEGAYPYVSVDAIHDGYSCGLVARSATDPSAAPQWGVANHSILPASDAALQAAVLRRPVSVGLCAGDEWQHYTGGVLTGDCCTDIDHGVLAVGYGVDDSDGDGDGDGASGLAYWKIKNSWAETWGEAGYIRLERVDDGVGLCGMLTYLTDVEVQLPTCADDSFCNANGTATRLTKKKFASDASDASDDDDGDDWHSPAQSGKVEWGCECTCGDGHAGRQCDDECVSDADCDGDANLPFCSSLGSCAAAPSLPDGCQYGGVPYLNDDFPYEGQQRGLELSSSSSSSVFCAGDLFCKSDAAVLNASLAALGRQPALSAFAFSCSMLDMAADAAWALSVGEGLKMLPPTVTSLRVDVGFSAGFQGDDLATMMTSARAGLPALENLTLVAPSTRLSDAGAAALGKALQGGTPLTYVGLNLRLNDIDDDGGDDTAFLTAAGAAALATSLGQLPALSGLSLSLFQCVNISAAGVQAVGDAMAGAGAFPALESLNLNLEETMFSCGNGDVAPCNAAAGAVGAGVAALATRSKQSSKQGASSSATATPLRALEFRFAANDEDEDGDAQLAEGLQCAIDAGLVLDDDFNENCGCNIVFDATDGCLKPTTGDDQSACFVCGGGGGGGGGH